MLRASGLSVYLLDKPLDLLVGYSGVTVLAEVKMPKNKKGEAKAYTPVQVKFLDQWKGGHYRLVTTDDALELAKAIKQKARAA